MIRKNTIWRFGCLFWPYLHTGCSPSTRRPRSTSAIGPMYVTALLPWRRTERRWWMEFLPLWPTSIAWRPACSNSASVTPSPWKWTRPTSRWIIAFVLTGHHVGVISANNKTSSHPQLLAHCILVVAAIMYPSDFTPEAHVSFDKFLAAVALALSDKYR